MAKQTENLNSIQSGQKLKLTILITVVSGKEAVLNCLNALSAQVNFENTEIIVPFDKWSKNVGELSETFPQVNFHFIEDLGLAVSGTVTSHQHRLFDRRRAVGLNLSRGQIIAMTEDHAIPANDWCQQIIELHKLPYGVIGGAIENKVDQPINWAWYYCDFGRYGKPLTDTDALYVSDINVSYKRKTIMSVREYWKEAYHETTVHWVLRSLGEKLYLTDQMIVYQQRPELKLPAAFRERIEWGRIFAETRSKNLNLTKRLIYVSGGIFLPILLLFRLLKNMNRQQRTFSQMLKTGPIALFLLIGWTVGETLGYIHGEPKLADFVPELQNQRSLASDK